MNTRYLLLSFSAAACIAAAAQENLTKEIDVEREIVPELRAASRMNIYPAALRPDIKPVSLSPGELTAPVQFNPLTRRYEPAWTGFAAEPTPYRGYVDLGYFPAVNLGLSAGYRAVDTSDTSLDIWLNILNRKYADKGATAADDAPDYKTFDAAAGAALRHSFGQAGTLSVSTAFEFALFNKAFLDDTDQKVSRWDIGAAWNGNGANSLRYLASLDFSLMHFGEAGFSRADLPDIPADHFPASALKAVGEKQLGLKLGASLPAGEYGRAGVDFAGDFLFYNRFVSHDRFVTSLIAQTDPDIVGTYMDFGGRTIGNLSLSPYYTLTRGMLTGKIGLKADLTVNSGKSIHVAPDVNIGLNPAPQVGLWVKFGGGEELNSLRSLYAVSRYISPQFAYKASNIPVTGEVGLRVGPFKGISLQVGGAYANAHDWLMPQPVGGLNGFSPCNLHAFKGFAALTGKWGSWIEVSVRYDRRFGDGADNLWYTWRDGARSVLSGDITIHPIKRLTVSVGTDARFECALAAGDPYNPSPSDFVNLRAGAQYRITDALGVFARFDNILNQHKPMIFDYTTGGFNGLFGLGYKF